MAKTKEAKAPKNGLRPWSLSPTCIKTFNQCLLKYWYQYIKKEKGLDDSIHLRFGTAVHSALEELGKRLQAGQLLTTELCEEIAELVPSIMAENRIDDLELIKEAQQIVRDRYYKHNPSYRIVSTELSFYKAHVTTNKGVPLNGVIDLMMEIDPQTVIVLDYKTSRRADSAEEARSDVQLSMYDLMVSKCYPQYKHIWLVLDFLRSEWVLSERTEEERHNFETWVNALWLKMGQMTEADVVPTLNQYCPWCAYRHLCKEYESIFNEELTLVPTLALTTDEEFTEEWMKAKALEKAADNRIQELKRWADNKAAMEGKVQFTGETAVVSWGQGQRKYYDPKALVQHIPTEDLAKLINFKNKDVEDYAKTRPDLRPLIERALRNNPGAPRITTRSK